jgi:hypothetical protein
LLECKKHIEREERRERGMEREKILLLKEIKRPS